MRRNLQTQLHLTKAKLLLKSLVIGRIENNSEESVIIACAKTMIKVFFFRERIHFYLN